MRGGTKAIGPCTALRGLRPHTAARPTSARARGRARRARTDASPSRTFPSPPFATTHARHAPPHRCGQRDGLGFGARFAHAPNLSLRFATETLRRPCVRPRGPVTVAPDERSRQVSSSAAPEPRAVMAALERSGGLESGVLGALGTLLGNGVDVSAAAPLLEIRLGRGDVPRAAWRAIVLTQILAKASRTGWKLVTPRLCLRDPLKRLRCAAPRLRGRALGLQVCERRSRGRPPKRREPSFKPRRRLSSFAAVFQAS